MKWSEDETMKLVKLYREHECLWNIGSVHYRNQRTRQAAYANIIRHMNKPDFRILELKQKIKNLRCTYNQEIAKINRSKASGRDLSDVYVPNLKWFNIMDAFIKIVKAMSQTQCSMENSQTEQPNTPKANDNKKDENAESTGDNSNPARERDFPSTSQLPSSKHAEKRKASPGKPHFIPSKKAKGIQTSNEIEVMSDSGILTQTPQVAFNIEDSYQQFGNYVASMLRTIGHPDAMLMQQQITTILTSAPACPDDDNQNEKNEIFEAINHIKSEPESIEDNTTISEFQNDVEAISDWPSTSNENCSLSSFTDRSTSNIAPLLNIETEKEYELIVAKFWAAKLKLLAPERKLFTEKAVSDILYKAHFQSLNLSSP